MTLDVTIGKMVLRKGDGIRPYIWVEQCPIADENICDIEYTICPNESYRSGSSPFRQF